MSKIQKVKEKMENKSLNKLYNYQIKNFKYANGFDFDSRAYPETATGVHLDGIARALRLKDRVVKFGVTESCEELRSRILEKISLDGAMKVEELKDKITP